MSLKNILCSVAVVSALFVGVRAASAAVITNSPAGSPPPVDGADLAQLVIGTNVTAPDSNDAIFMFSDRPAQGQSFTTGSNSLGYTFDAFTIQRWGAAGATNYPSAQPLLVRITQLSGTTITVIHTETAAGVAVDALNDDEYVTFTLDTPQTLSPNTTYGFDTGMTFGGWGLLGNNADPFAGGAAYSTGDNGIGTLLAEFRDGDRVFHVNLVEITPPLVPEPASFFLLAIGSASLSFAARRKSRAGRGHGGMVPFA